MRLYYFDNFRAIAILFVVIGHLYKGWTINTFPEIFVTNIISGGTALFVFVSGFFLHAVFYKKFEYKKFMIKKFSAVAVPYLILSALFFAAYFAYKGFIPFPDYLRVYAPDDVTRAFVSILTGRHLTAYWYIPFIMLVFILTPVILPFFKLSKTNQSVILIALFALASVIHRPALDMNPLYSFFYFIPFYLFGAFYSINRETLQPFVMQRLVWFVGLLLIVLALMAWQGQIGNLHRWIPWDFQGFDWMIPQKILLICVLLGFLSRYMDYRSPALSFIASISFPLFFIHPWFIAIVSITNFRDMLPPEFPGFVIYAAIVLSASILSAVIVMKGLGKNSKYVIGA